MIEVDNFDKLIPLMGSRDDDKSVFLVWLVKRNKDGHDDVKGNNKNRTIKTYIFQSASRLVEHRTEIMRICWEFHCRAYICLNPRNTRDMLFTLQRMVVNKIQESVGKVANPSIRGILDSAFMKTKPCNDKYWVVDVDDTDQETCDAVLDAIENSRSEFQRNTVITLPTAHGYHIITHPFDPRTMKTMMPCTEIKKDGLTLLYAYLNE